MSDTSGRHCKKRKIEKPVQLLVEGRTAEIFFREMVHQAGLTEHVQVWDFGGVKELPHYLAAFVTRPEFKETVKALGVVRDAENKGADNAFRSVADSLGKVGLAPPNTPGSVRGGAVKIGVFIFPDCERPGMLEDLCLTSVEDRPDGPMTLSCVDGYFECLQRNGVPAPTNMTKARTWAFLSAQDLSDPQVGRAAQAGVWPWGSPAFATLMAFLRALAKA